MSTVTPRQNYISNLQYATHIKKELLISSHLGTGREFLAHLTSYHLEALMKSKLCYSSRRVGGSEDLINGSGGTSGQSVNQEIKGQKFQVTENSGRYDSQIFQDLLSFSPCNSFPLLLQLLLFCVTPIQPSQNTTEYTLYYQWSAPFFFKFSMLSSQFQNRV